MSEYVDCVVVGAGVVGLAVARELALGGREVVILEAQHAVGTGISSRNSEVIHAGIYYPADSLKARACVAGKRMLYDYCASRGVAHRRCGKLIVATDQAQLGELERIEGQARANGVTDLQLLDGPAARALEPALRARGALLSHSTGIVDSHGLITALLGEAEAAGAALALGTPFRGAAARSGGLVVDCGGPESMRLGCRRLVLAAGLGTPSAALAVEGLDPARVPPLYFAKGSYFGLGRKAPFGRLIYPVPEPGGLGVHLTMDLAGIARFGPDVEWVAQPGYTVDPARADGFYAAIRRYWPGLPDGALRPDYAGVRPKLHRAGEAAADFLVQGEREHGVAGLVSLFGIESPGLTACLYLAREVVAALGLPAAAGPAP